MFNHKRFQQGCLTV